MRTTVRLDPALMAKAKKESARTGETFTAMIERGLRLVLARPRQSRFAFQYHGQRVACVPE